MAYRRLRRGVNQNPFEIRNAETPWIVAQPDGPSGSAAESGGNARQ